MDLSKPVAIVAAGKSIKELTNYNLPEDVYWIFINAKKTVYDVFYELDILPSLVTMYASCTDKTRADGPGRHMDVCEKDVIRYYLSNRVPILLGPEHNNKDFIEEYKNFNTQFIDWEPDYDWDKPYNHTNSIMKLLVYLEYHGCKNVVIFGCDGFGPGYEQDTEDMNRRINSIVQELSIYNANPVSKVNAFKRISQQEGIELLCSNFRYSGST